MTGFHRPNRSFYLDDMDVVAGQQVICRSSIGSPQFTAGKAYPVQPDGSLIDDTGFPVYPSARFTHA